MDPKGSLYIELSEYGGEGRIELAPPSFRRQTETKTDIARYTKTKVVNGKAVVDSIDYGMAEIAILLQFVRKAPFPINAEGFLEYCDSLDEKDTKNSSELFKKIYEVAGEIKEGNAGSPFVGLQDQATVSSE